MAGPPPPPPPPPTGGLVAAYGFNEAGGASVTDLSGSGNSGTAAGTSWSTNGKYGQALSFNGTSGIVTIPDSNSLDLTSGMTVEAWVNPSALGATTTSWRTVAFKERIFGGMTYALYANNGLGALPGRSNSTSGGELSAVGLTPLPLSVWTHPRGHLLTALRSGST